ncbi:MAG: phenylalanine--tRNA ligase subunit beta [Alphaproteobacteria bacterium]|nr:phenylalanine--tRNA ligase subunit beta [Alphaproteobacteria bacterium]
MKFTLDWLKDYLKTNVSVDEIAECLTNIGLEIDGIEYPVRPIAAKIVECADIPDTHLHLLRVDDGTGTLRQVVCGAKNARAGLVSALALPGCKVGDMEIKSGKIRGHLSDGMMCSAKELGIGDDHDGIIELNESSETIGRPLKSEIRNQKSEIVFTAGITPNRPDYLSVRGIARDLAAAGIGEIINHASDIIECKGQTRKATIENTAACPVYRLCEIRGINMAPSNPTIAARIEAIGINPKNAPIDATNYVCYDMGQPLHCFDADEINGDIIIRNAKAGEKFTDLFGAEHELIDTDLVITDADGILALAGVVGGSRGMTTDATKNVILESAYFDPVTIRKTAKRLGISTDASYRYERGIDPTITGLGIVRAARIIQNACGGEIISNYEAGHDPVKLRKIGYKPGLFEQKTGIGLEYLPAPVQREILEKLGFGVEISGDDWTVTPPPARVDVLIPENIVSELARIFGYCKILGQAAEGNMFMRGQYVAEVDKLNDQDKNLGGFEKTLSLKQRIATLGLYEIKSYGFGSSKQEKLLSDKPSVKIENPIVSDMDTARNGLVHGMLGVIANNDRFNRSNLNLFEVGAVFDGVEPGEQHDQLVIARTGIAGGNIGAKHGRPVGIYDVREDLLALFPGATVENGINGEATRSTKYEGWAHPFRAGRIILNGQTVAQFAELHPAIAKKFGIKTNVVIGLVDDISMLPEQAAIQPSTLNIQHSQNAVPDFPLITRDFAFIVDNKISPDEMVNYIAANNPIVYETNVFDVFDMGNSKKSVAFELILQPTGNMSDGDLAEFQSKIINDIESKFDAKIRDK